MIKLFTVCFLIGFSFCALASQSFLSKCYSHFRSDSDIVKYQLSEDTQWTNPYAKKLFSFVYKPLSLLEGKALSHKEMIFFSSYFEKLINDIESSSNPNIQNRLNLMNSRWSEAVQAFPEIVSFVNSGKSSGYESLDTKTIIQLILSTFAHHTRAYLTHSRADHLDWPRINLILNSISEFKNKPSVFSLYKIKRAVAGKYSLNEYINCR